MNWTMHICDVHRLVDKDEAPRECKYCPRCKSWICKECHSNWTKRAQAMVLAKAQMFNPKPDGANINKVIDGKPTGNPNA